MTSRPPMAIAFMFYPKAFNSAIVIMVQSLGDNTLPDVYDLAIRA